MNYRIDGDNLPVLKVRLSAGEQIECEAGAMSWMDDEIEMQTKAGGLGRMFGRMFTNESAFTNICGKAGRGDSILVKVSWFYQGCGNYTGKGYYSAEGVISCSLWKCGQ